MKLFPVWCIEDCMMHLRLLYYTFIIYHTLSSTVLSFCKKVKSDEEHKNTGMICRYKCIAIYSSGAGTEYRSRFTSGISREKKKVIVVHICKEPWSDDLDCMTELKFGFLFPGRFPVFP